MEVSSWARPHPLLFVISEFLYLIILRSTYLYCNLLNPYHFDIKNLGVAADMTSYNVLLKSCCLSGQVDIAQDIYREVQRLQSSGMLKLDLFTYSTIIKVCMN